MSTIYQDVKELLDQVPKNTKLNGALTQMAIHLQAGASIADMVRFESGVGDTSSVATLPYPLEMGTPETVLRKRKSPQAETVTTATTSKEKTTSRDNLHRVRRNNLPRSRKVLLMDLVGLM